MAIADEETYQLVHERCTKRMLDDDRSLGREPECPHCGDTMVLRRSTVGGGGDNPYRDDQTWKCMNCKHVSTFGIPVTKKVHDREVNLRGGTVFCPEANTVELDDDKVKEKLEALGYLEN